VSSFANDEPPEPSDQEIEYTLCTVDTVKECHFEDILANISQLPIETLSSLLLSLLAQIPEDGSPRVIVVKPELPNAPSPRTNGNKSKLNRPTYDPSLVFVLELATVLALRDEETVRELAKDVTDALASVIRDASKLHPVVIARSVYYLLSLLKASNVSSSKTSILSIYSSSRRTSTSSALLYYYTRSQSSTRSCSSSVLNPCLKDFPTVAKARSAFEAN
jgi:golgi-specific brefeldin A-resistance guanine nucleotide exchange factor 1